MNHFILSTKLVCCCLCNVYVILGKNLSVIFNYMLLPKLRKYVCTFIIKKIVNIKQTNYNKISFYVNGSAIIKIDLCI